MIGKTVNGSLIVGVVEPGFELLLPPSANVERRPDIWSALRLRYDHSQRLSIGFRLIGRLKQGAAIDQAQAQADIMAADERQINLIERSADYHVRLEPMHQHVVEEVRPALLALMGAVIFLLLIACANVANLLLVRASLRERELAIRTALGGSWWRLVSQTLAEAALLAFSGALLGLGLAWVGIHELRAMAPASLPRLDAIGSIPRCWGSRRWRHWRLPRLFGLAPAVRAARPSVAVLLRASGRNAGLGGVGLLRNFVVVAEVALSFVLLIGSGLMFRSFLELQRIDPGFNPHGLLTFLLAGRPGQSGTHRSGPRAYAICNTRLEALPGVKAVTASFPLPLAGGFSPIRWGLEAALTDPSKFQAADFQIVLPGYFEVLHTPLIAGRTFTEADNDGTGAWWSSTRCWRRRHSPAEIGGGQALADPVQTPEAGVGGSDRGGGAPAPDVAGAGGPRADLFDGRLSLGHGAVSYWAVRTAGDPAIYASAVRAAIDQAGPATAGDFEMQPMDALVETAQAGTHFSLLLIGVFAAIAVLLAGVGLYGVLSTVVRQRTPEIGVRMALGAAPARIFSLVIGQGLRLSAAGIALGILAASGD